MSVDHPLRLVAGIAVLVLFAIIYRWLAHRATEHDLAYSDVPFFMHAARPRAWIPIAFEILWLAAIAAVVVAVARPQLTLPVPVRDGAVFICIDTSGSMASTDVFPTRAQAARAAAHQFIDEAPAGTRIGIIAFAGTAALVSPLRADHGAVVAALGDIPAPNGATAIGDALRLAAQLLPSTGHRAVILVTDGVNNAGTDPSEISQWLGAHHVPIYTVGIGTTAGGLIPGTDQEATIDDGALRAYAERSGGAYSRVENATQLRDALARLGRTTSFERKPVDASLAFAVGGAFCMLAAFLGGLGMGRYP